MKKFHTCLPLNCQVLFLPLPLDIHTIKICVFLIVFVQVRKFALFQQTLQNVYEFAQKLPGDSCPIPTTTPPPTEPITTPPSSTTSPPSTTPHSPTTPMNYSQSPTLETDFPYTTFPEDFLANFTNSSAGWNSTWFNMTTSQTTASTTPFIPTTTPKPPKKPTPPPTPKSKIEEQNEKVAQLYRLWATMQERFVFVTKLAFWAYI